MNRKKRSVGLTAVITAAIVLLSGTFAWQSNCQTALNEASDIVNPGGRLHDDFDGQNKDVYVENFADEPIFARIRLGEFLALTNNKGISGAERENILIGSRGDNGENHYVIHHFDTENLSDAYWIWHTGGETVYMPTFNKNKDSLAADLNGTYLGPDGKVTELPGDDRYTDYTTYWAGEAKIDTEIYDADANDTDEVGNDFEHLANYAEAGNIRLLEGVEHTAKQTLNAELIAMSDWLSMVERDGGYDAEKHGSCWVYDTDGWVYWSAPVAPDTATGLLIDGIQLKTVMDDSWYYAIEVTAQFVTADDIGKSDSSGFYDPTVGAEPSENAEALLEYITGAKLR